jgi:hypothetical protein
MLTYMGKYKLEQMLYMISLRIIHLRKMHSENFIRYNFSDKERKTLWQTHFISWLSVISNYENYAHTYIKKVA